MQPVLSESTRSAPVKRPVCTETAPQVATLFAAGLPPPIAQLLGLATLSEIYARAVSTRQESSSFLEAALVALNVTIQAEPSECAHIPPIGPTLIVANHPFGALDGLVAAAIASRQRTDVRVLANEWLYKIPELKRWLLSVDVFGNKDRRHSNANTLKAALQHLKSGGLLIVFPAGVVSHWQPERGGIIDPAWNRLAAVLARRTVATVVPMYFEGSNSWLFHAAGLIHPQLRTALLPRELLQKRASCIHVRVGHPVSRSAIEGFQDDESLTGWFRLRTYDLACRRFARTPRSAGNPHKPVVAPVDSEKVFSELSNLDSTALLVSQGPYQVFLAPAASIPNTLKEIGRLREITFRAVGEGTGAAYDVDRFDQYYLQLVLVDKDKRCIVGGYRIGPCDAILRNVGLPGIYTSTLFRYHPSFIRELHGTVELGRSFVRAEYQRSPLALALLWRGIGQFLVRNPHYDHLMGPVSISGSYGDVAQRLMISYLEGMEIDHRVKNAVKPRRPPRRRLAAFDRDQLMRTAMDVRKLGRLVADLDAAHRGVPVLLDRYLDLGGRVLAVNVDPAFGNCVDALVIVNVPRAPESTLRRFMGAEGLKNYIMAQSAAIKLTA